jgi:hypothetical protein
MSCHVGLCRGRLASGDKAIVHTPQEEEAKDQADEGGGKKKGGGDMADLCLMPPTLTRSMHFLAVTVYGAEGMPAMDDKKLGGLIKAGIDAFVQVKVRRAPVCMCVACVRVYVWVG